MNTDAVTDIAPPSIAERVRQRSLPTLDASAGLGVLRRFRAKKRVASLLRVAIYLALLATLVGLAAVRFNRFDWAEPVLGAVLVLVMVAWWLFEKQLNGFQQTVMEAEKEVAERNRKLQMQVSEGTRELLMLAQELSMSNDELRREMDARAKVEVELRQAQKLESVGRLAAGVAHEINTPVQFVNDSVYFLREGVHDLARLIGCYREALSGQGGMTAGQCAAIEDELDLDYLLEKLPQAIERSVEGLGRVATIVRSMKEFAHPEGKEKIAADINQAIESTLVIARNEYKYVADLETDYGELPLAPVYLSELNQAVLNIVVNAAHAIGDQVEGTEKKGLIKVSTRYQDHEVIIQISDTGDGIPEDIQDKIFDPFFTTKEVGKGTGQGLGVVHSVVVEKHHGHIDIDSIPGDGTTFTLHIPVSPVEKPNAQLMTEDVSPSDLL